jgi:hypothetical protein
VRRGCRDARSEDPGHAAASSFSARVDNVWFPLRPGSRYVYMGVKDAKPARDVVVVTHRTKTIDGVPCVGVSDRLYLRGSLEERTTDWYSQDAKGDVWYFGDSTSELDPHGHVTSTEGTWTAGVNGARPGIYMTTNPRVGQSWEQEYYKGHAQDQFKVIGVFGTNAVLTGDNTARARNCRPQAVRARRRHRARADRGGPERTQRARLLHARLGSTQTVA